MRAGATQKTEPATAPALTRAGERAVKLPQAPIAVDTSYNGDTTARHAGLLASPPYARSSGHEPRTRLVQQLQAGYGNQHVGQVIARMQQVSENTRLQASAPRALPPEPAVASVSGNFHGRELLADASTPIVEQNGSAVQTKANQAADAKTWTPYSPSKKGMLDCEYSDDTGIQRLSSQCEIEQQQAQKEDETEGAMQVNALSRPFSGTGLQSRVLGAHADPSVLKLSAGHFIDGRTALAGFDSDRSLNGNAGNLSRFNAPVSDRPPSTPQTRIQSRDNALAMLQPPATIGIGSKPTGEDISLIAKAVESTSVPEERMKFSKEAGGQGDKELTQTETLGKVPEVKAVENLLADTRADNLLPEGNAEAASSETVAQRSQATKDASETQALLDEKNAELAQPAPIGINFVLPGNAITLQGEGVPAFLRRRREVASRMADQFLAAAANRKQTLAKLGQEIFSPIQTAAKEAKTSITSTVEQQRAELAAQIAQQREQAQNAAQETHAEIQNQHQRAVAAVSGVTSDNRQKIETEQIIALQTLDERKKDQLAKVDELYTRVDKECRDIGVRAGDDALAVGEEKARQWESQVKGYDDNLWDGPLTDNRLRAKARAAREVAKQYKPSLIDGANKNAAKIQEGKAKDVEAFEKDANDSRQAIVVQKTSALDALNVTEQQALSQAQAAQSNFTVSANQSLQLTLQSFDQEESVILQLLTVYGQRQVLTIDGDAKKVIGSLQQGVNRAVTSLQGMLDNIEAEIQGKETPDLNSFASVLADLLGQAEEAVASAQAQTREGIAASERGINEGGQKAVKGIAPIARNGLEEAAATEEKLTVTLADLKQGATQTFNEIRQIYTTTTTNLANSAREGFHNVTEINRTNFEGMTQNLDSGLQKSAKDVEKTLRDSLGEMRAKIEEEAKKAADQEEPRWKSVLKIFVVLLVVVVAVVAGPAVIGAVGAAAGALGASAAAAGAIGAVVGGAIVGAVAGTVIQMADNLIDGKNLFEGVGQAALFGAIGGALGGLGGLAGQGLTTAFKLGSSLAQKALTLGIDTGFGVAGDALGSLATGTPITWQGLLIGAAIGAGFAAVAAGAGKIKGAIDGAPPGSRSHEEVPPVKHRELEVKESEIGVKSTETHRGSTHYGEPEVVNKPGVVASDTASGHETNVLQDDRVVRCTQCEPLVPNLKEKHAKVFEKNHDAIDRLEHIEKIPDPSQKLSEFKKFEGALEKHSVDDLMSVMNRPQTWREARKIAKKVEAESETLLRRLKKEEDRRRVKEAILDYVGDSSQINQAARGQLSKQHLNESVTRLTDALTLLRAQRGAAQQHFVTYRLVIYDEFSEIPFGKKIKVGEFVSDKGFFSTSKHRQFILGKAQKKAPNVLLKFVILGKAGVPISIHSPPPHTTYTNANEKVAWKDVEKDAWEQSRNKFLLAFTKLFKDKSYAGQAEVLFDRGTVFKVEGIERYEKKGIVNVILRETDNTGKDVKDMTPPLRKDY